MRKNWAKKLHDSKQLDRLAFSTGFTVRAAYGTQKFGRPWKPQKNSVGNDERCGAVGTTQRPQNHKLKKQ